MGQTHGVTPEGIPIVAMKAVVTKTGDALSKAVDAEPIVVEAQGVTYIAFRVRKVKDRYDYATNEAGEVEATRVQIFDALNATFIDEKAVAKSLERTAGKVAALAALRVAGQPSFDLDDPEGILDEPDPRSLPNAKRDREKHADLADAVDEALGGAA